MCVRVVPAAQDQSNRIRTIGKEENAKKEMIFRVLEP
jgi:hypothetical protein